MILAQLVCAALVGVGSSCLSQQDGVSVNGRVVDGGGTPVAAAEIQVWHKVRRDGKPQAENERLSFDGRESLESDSNGRFATPRVLKPDEPIRVIVLADGFLAARSPWVKPSEGNSIDIGDMVVRRLRTVTGRVVDRHGKPVAEAAVFHAGDAHKSERATTDAEGRFSLPGVPDGRAILFVEKPGLRFTGMLLDSSMPAIEMVVARADESVEALKTMPPKLGPFEEIDLARRLLEPYLKAATESGADIDKNWAISALGHFDPIEALELIDRTKWGNGMKQRTRDWVIELAIERQPPERIEEIRPFIESSDSSESAAAAYILLARALPAGDRAKRLDCVKGAIPHARKSKEPERLLLLAQIAEHLFELGEEAEATRLAQEVRKVAETSSNEVLGWTLGVIPLALARIDLNGALALLNRLPDGDYALRMGMLALRLADRDPAEAERVWNLPASRETEDRSFLMRRDARRAARVCYYMAPADRERARRIADGVYDPRWRTYGLGAMAYGLMESDPLTARELLLQVFAGPGPKLHPDHTRYGPPLGYRAIMIAWLLPIAEQVDPELAREFFWRSLALRSPRPVDDWLENEVEMWDAELITMLARYDRRLARSLLEPLAEPVLHAVKLSGESPLEMGSVFNAATVVDPEWAVELLNGLPEPPDAGAGRPRNRARFWVVQILSSQGKWRWHEAGYWHPASPRYY